MISRIMDCSLIFDDLDKTSKVLMEVNSLWIQHGGKGEKSVHAGKKSKSKIGRVTHATRR